MRARDVGASGPACTAAVTLVACVLALFLTTAPVAVSSAAAQAPPPGAPAGPGASPPGGPPAPPGRVLSLAEAIDIALRQQPTIRSAREGVNSSAARIGETQSGYYPRLDWVTSGGRSQAFSSSLGQSFTSNSISTAAQGRQLLWDFGKTGAQVEEARAGLRLSEGELRRVGDTVVFDVKQTYFLLLQAQRLVGVADAAVARAELNLRSARGFFEVGTRPKSDVTKAEVEVANALVNQIRARNLVRLSRAGLANALGYAATTPLEIQDILAYQPMALDQATFVTEALANRPELAQARARLDAARAQVAGARAGYWPDVVATGSYGGSSSDFPPNETWAVSGTLSWNIFQGFFTRERVKETQAQVEAARANFDAVELQVRLEVEQTYIAVSDAGERIGATQKAVESAQENLRLAQGRYDAGVGTILELTDAQLALTNAEADLVRALTDNRVAIAALERAIGRR